MLQADVVAAHERGHEMVFEAAQFEADIVVEETHGDFVQLLRNQTDVFQIGGPVDLLDDAALDVVGQRLERFPCCCFRNCLRWHAHSRFVVRRAQRSDRPIFEWPWESISLGRSIHDHVTGLPVASTKLQAARISGVIKQRRIVCALGLAVRIDGSSPLG